LNKKVLQGSVVTRLECDEVFNHQLIAYLLISPIVKELWKSVNILRSYWQEQRVLFFYSDICISTHPLCMLISV